MERGNTGTVVQGAEQARVLTKALEAAANAVAITNTWGVIEWVNPAFTRTTGYAFDEAVGRTPGELIGSGQHDEAFFRDFWETIRSGRVWRGRMVNRRKDGTLYPEDQTVTPVVDDQGRVSHYIAVKVDLSEQEQADDRIRLQATLLDAVGQAVIGADSEGCVIYWNRAAEELFGWSADEAMGEAVTRLTVPEGSMVGAQQVMDQLRRGERWTGEFELLRKDGSTFPGLVTDSPIFDDKGRLVGVIGVSSDISELKGLEAKLRHAQKMEAVGHLAGGVAHDFNNLLAAIQARALLLAEGLPPDSALGNEAAELLSEVQRGTRLTRQLLDTARRRPGHTETVDLAREVREMEPMLRRLLDPRVGLRLELPPTPVPVTAARSGVEQVVMNLVTNAGDAVEGSGTVTIRVHACELSPDERARVRGAASEGSFGCLTVEDTGSGIAPQILERVFDPFFTTKPEGKGTGLGLSTVFGIVEAHGGGVIVDTAVGAGCAFRVLLPLSPSGPGEEDEADHRGRVPGPSSPRHATVLVVDDDRAIRRVAGRALQRAGYEVLAAGSATEALEIMAQQGDQVGVVVTDLVMPGLDGSELMRRIHRIHPGVRVVVVSGYDADQLPRDSRRDAAGFLSKPFSPDDLTGLVAQVLGPK